MRIGIVGQKWLAAELLARLAPKMQIAFAIVPTYDDRLAAAAEEHGVRRVFLTEQPIETFDPEEPIDLLIAAHAHVRVPARLRRLARWSIGYHPSLLPLYRGRNAIEDTVAAGDRIAGGTVYHLEERMDAGAIVAQDWCFIHPGETAAGLWRRALAPMGLRMLEAAALTVGRGRELPALAQADGFNRN